MSQKRCLLPTLKGGECQIILTNGKCKVHSKRTIKPKGIEWEIVDGKHRLLDERGRPVSFSSFVGSSEFLEEFVEYIQTFSRKNPPFMILFPPFSKRNAGDFFFWIVVDKSLEHQPDHKPFAVHLRKAKGEVAVFSNISGDCRLVVPTPPGNFTHLQEFSREASFQRQVRFWRTVFSSLKEFAEEHEEVWLNTHGHGVHWLHVRLDLAPKYYPNEIL